MQLNTIFVVKTPVSPCKKEQSETFVLISMTHWNWSEMAFKALEQRFKSAKTRFKLSGGLNLEAFDTILSGTNHI